MSDCIRKILYALPGLILSAFAGWRFSGILSPVGADGSGFLSYGKP